MMYRTGLFLFPFLKELFLGKEYKENEQKSTNTKSHPSNFAFLKKFLIISAMASFVVNVLLIKKTYDMAYRLLETNKELRRMESAYDILQLKEPNKLRRPVTIIEPVVPTKPEVPVPAPKENLTTKLAPPRRTGVTVKREKVRVEEIDGEVAEIDRTHDVLLRLREIDEIK